MVSQSAYDVFQLPTSCVSSGRHDFRPEELEMVAAYSVFRLIRYSFWFPLLRFQTLRP
jgi:hypothetical protein